MKKILIILLLVITNISLAADANLGSGDLIRISVYGNSDLNIETRVTEKNTINFPLIGEVNIEGRNTSQTETLIAGLLEKKGFLRDPQVNIVVLEFLSQQVSVLGGVYKPGKITLDKASTLTDIVAEAGGITPNGSDLITIQSEKDGIVKNYEFDLNLILQNKEPNFSVTAGDIIYVHERQVSILGHVTRPGKYSITPNTRTLVDFIAAAGGISVDGSSIVNVITHRTDGLKKYTVDLNEIFEDAISSHNIELGSNDIVYVPEASKFYIYGEVNRPGTYMMKTDMTVAQALAVGGGISVRGTENGLLIKRLNMSSGDLININADTSTFIQKNDVVFVKESLF